MTQEKREQLYGHMNDLRPDIVVIQDTRTDDHEHAHPKSRLRDLFPGFRMATAAVPGRGRGDYIDKVGGQWIIYNTAKLSNLKLTEVIANGVCVMLEFRMGGRTGTVISSYWPQVNTNDTSLWHATGGSFCQERCLESFIGTAENARGGTGFVVSCGDFNMGLTEKEELSLIGRTATDIGLLDGGGDNLHVYER
jgi:exonuclease III